MGIRNKRLVKEVFLDVVRLMHYYSGDIHSKLILTRILDQKKSAEAENTPTLGTFLSKDSLRSVRSELDQLIPKTSFRGDQWQAVFLIERAVSRSPNSVKHISVRCEALHTSVKYLLEEISGEFTPRLLYTLGELPVLEVRETDPEEKATRLSRFNSKKNKKNKNLINKKA